MVAIFPASCYRQARGSSRSSSNNWLSSAPIDHSAIADDIPLPISKLIVSKRGANRLTLHVLAAAAEHERHDRRAHAPCPVRRQDARDQARQSKAGRDQPGEGGRASSSLAPAHRALHRGWPHVEQCDSSLSQRARHRGTEWWSMVSDAG